MSSLLFRAVGQRHLAEGVVQKHSGQQQHADDQAGPVAVKVGVVDALGHDGECDGAKDDADHRAESAGQQNTAHNHSNNGIEDVGLPARHLCRIEKDGLAHADKRSARGRDDEERDGHARRRNTGIARCDTVPTHGENPIAVFRVVYKKDVGCGSRQPPGDDDLELLAEVQVSKNGFGKCRSLDGDTGCSGDDD
jgi:hypothetical protein